MLLNFFNFAYVPPTDLNQSTLNNELQDIYHQALRESEIKKQNEYDEKVTNLVSSIKSKINHTDFNSECETSALSQTFLNLHEPTFHNAPLKERNLPFYACFSRAKTYSKVSNTINSLKPFYNDVLNELMKDETLLTKLKPGSKLAIRSDVFSITTALGSPYYDGTIAIVLDWSTPQLSNKKTTTFSRGN